jgi:hypothetical protein
LVAEAVGLPGNAYYVEPHPRAEAYLALDHRLPAFPDNDAALVWDEHRGWALAVELGPDLLIAGYLPTAETVPQPRVVAEYAKSASDGDSPGTPEPARTDTPSAVLARLAAYASPFPADDLW